MHFVFQIHLCDVMRDYRQVSTLRRFHVQININFSVVDFVLEIDESIWTYEISIAR